MTTKQSPTTEMDPIIFEILRSTFAAVSTEMGLVIAKTAYSTSINEGRDFSSSIFDADGGQVAQGEFGLPAFVGVTQVTVPEVIKGIGLENIRPGDIYMVNDPYTRTAMTFTSSSLSSMGPSEWRSSPPPATGTTWAARRPAR